MDKLQKQLRRSGNISQWSIDHPHMVIAFFLGVIILAVIAIGFYMPRRMMPYVESPMVGVVTMMPGLSSQEMEKYISKPIEEQLVNIKHLRYIRSASQDGFSIVSLEFDYGTNMQRALFDVQALMNVVQANLPNFGANLKPSWVLPIDPLNLPVLSLSLTGKGWSPDRLRQFADNEVVNKLKTVRDVYSVVPYGGYRRQLQVIVDRRKLEAYGLSILDVKSAMDRYNVSRAAGTLTSGPDETIIRVDTGANDANTVLNYPIKAVAGSTAGSNGNAGTSGSAAGGGMNTMGGGAAAQQSPTGNTTPAVAGTFLEHPRTVYIRDVAHVDDSYWERRSAYHYAHDGRVESAIEVSVIQNPEASSAKVAPAVMAEVRKLESENPGVKFDVAYDNAHFVGILFKNMIEELALAILLTGLAVLLFLGEWRGALISLITIPTSLAMAILALVPMGMTLNSGTLIGLLLSIGRLVDDSIIDIHAVERELRLGKDRVRATVDGITQVRVAVMASTLMLCLALAPLLFCGGIVELMFRELVWPIIMGLLASMIVSFTLTSLLASRLLRTPAELERDRQSAFYRIALGPFQNLLDRMERGYSRAIIWMLKHRFSNMVRILATIIVGFAFYNFIGSEMMPLADVGQAYGVLEADPGTSFQRTEILAHQFEKILLKYPEVEKVSTEVGTETMFESFSPFYTGYAMPLVNSATFMITLSDKDARKRDIWQVMDGARAEALRTMPGIRRLQVKEMGADVMASSAAPIQLLVYGKDLGMIDDLSKQVAAVAAKTPGMAQVGTSWTMGNPSHEVQVDPARAQALGLSPDDIARRLYYMTRGGLTDEFYRLPNVKQNTVLVRLEPEERRNANDLASLTIDTPTGRNVPLSAFARIVPRSAPTLIEHDGGRRVSTVTGFYRKGGPASMDLTMEVLAGAATKVNFPPGYGLEMRGDMTQMMDSFRRLLVGLGIAIIFILLILVAQFRGFLQPLQMVFSIPLELSGIFVALYLSHQSFSTVSIMAVIVLTGMDMTTAILLVDMIMHYRDRGVPRNEAVIRACPQRLRPILITSIITIIVMIPVAFFPRTGIDAYQPLGTVVIGGLIVGTILSLFDIPIMHTYVDDFAQWLNRTFLKREYVWPVREFDDDDPA
jgi:hydrophobic/amphiphilic exporter-1 (mainly G- bacteria), HAE1 family